MPNPDTLSVPSLPDGGRSRSDSTASKRTSLRAPSETLSAPQQRADRRRSVSSVKSSSLSAAPALGRASQIYGADTLRPDRSPFLRRDDHGNDSEDSSESDLDDHLPVTGFAVASNRRNADFHALFPAVDEGDYLIEGK